MSERQPVRIMVNMRYKCGNCETTQWRGLFPDPKFHYRWAIFHGVILGICSIGTKLLFARFDIKAEGWRNGLASLGVCLALMLGIYAIAIFIEGIVIALRACAACGKTTLRLDW